MDGFRTNTFTQHDIGRYIFRLALGFTPQQIWLMIRDKDIGRKAKGLVFRQYEHSFSAIDSDKIILWRVWGYFAEMLAEGE